MQSLWLDLERSALRGLDRFAARFGPARTRPAHLRTGIRGENEALFFLRRHGYTIVARRWRCTEERGDLDLIAWEANCLCFIEVKSRTARDTSPAESAIDREKQRALQAMAKAYMRRMPREEREGLIVRFDAVAVYLLPRAVECELERDSFPLHPLRSKEPR
jgi:putative endonuclease